MVSDILQEGSLSPVFFFESEHREPQTGKPSYTESYEGLHAFLTFLLDTHDKATIPASFVDKMFSGMTDLGDISHALNTLATLHSHLELGAVEQLFADYTTKVGKNREAYFAFALGILGTSELSQQITEWQFYIGIADLVVSSTEEERSKLIEIADYLTTEQSATLKHVIAINLGRQIDNLQQGIDKAIKNGSGIADLFNQQWALKVEAMGYGFNPDRLHPPSLARD